MVYISFNIQYHYVIICIIIRTIQMNPFGGNSKTLRLSAKLKVCTLAWPLTISLLHWVPSFWDIANTHCIPLRVYIKICPIGQWGPKFEPFLPVFLGQHPDVYCLLQPLLLLVHNRFCWCCYPSEPDSCSSDLEQKMRPLAATAWLCPLFRPLYPSTTMNRFIWLVVWS